MSNAIDRSRKMRTENELLDFAIWRLLITMARTFRVEWLSESQTGVCRRGPEKGI